MKRAALIGRFTEIPELPGVARRVSRVGRDATDDSSNSLP